VFLISNIFSTGIVLKNVQWKFLERKQKAAMGDILETNGGSLNVDWWMH
jgi:hypothetical protein